MVKLPARKKDTHVYILWGLHFSSLRKPEERSDDGIFGALMHSFLMWMQKVSNSLDPVVKRHGMPILAFLYDQLILNFTPERLEQIADFNRRAAQQMMETLPAGDEDTLTRGYDEVILPSGHPDELGIEPG